MHHCTSQSFKRKKKMEKKNRLSSIPLHLHQSACFLIAKIAGENVETKYFKKKKNIREIQSDHHIF